MDIEITADPSAFAERVGPLLEAEPLSTNVIAVVLDRTLAGAAPVGDDDIWITVCRAGVTVGAGMCNGPYNLFLSRQRPGASEQIAEALHRIGRTLRGVTGEALSARAFAEAWCNPAGVDCISQLCHNVYRLDRLSPPAEVSGWPLVASADDVGLVASWFDDFHAEALPHDPAGDNTLLAERRIAAGEIVLWTDEGDPVAMAACSAPAAGTARIGPVFTPLALRGRGFAAGATAAVAANALARGAKRVMLYADKANPTSNGLYQRLGFTVDHDAEDLGFRP